MFAAKSLILWMVEKSESPVENGGKHSIIYRVKKPSFWWCRIPVLPPSVCDWKIHQFDEFPMKAGLESLLFWGNCHLPCVITEGQIHISCKPQSLVVSGKLSVLKPPCLMAATLRYTNIAMEKSPYIYIPNIYIYDCIYIIIYI